MRVTMQWGRLGLHAREGLLSCYHSAAAVAIGGARAWSRVVRHLVQYTYQIVLSPCFVEDFSSVVYQVRVSPSA